VRLVEDNGKDKFFKHREAKKLYRYLNKEYGPETVKTVYMVVTTFLMEQISEAVKELDPLSEYGDGGMDDRTPRDTSHLRVIK
jgi:hypothetical protein